MIVFIFCMFCVYDKNKGKLLFGFLILNNLFVFFKKEN